MLVYLDASKTFHLYADACNMQACGMLVQENQVLAF